MNYEADAQKAVAELKEFAFLAAFHLTVARRNETEIAEAILLSKQYQVCRKHAADEVLKEVIELQVEQGRALGHQELERQKSEADQVRKDRDAAEAKREQAGAEWKRIQTQRQEIELADERLREREARVRMFEDLEAEQSRLELKAAQERERIEEERRTAMDSVVQERKRVQAMAAQVAAEKAAVGKRWKWLLLAPLIIASALFIRAVVQSLANEPNESDQEVRIVASSVTIRSTDPTLVFAEVNMGGRSALLNGAGSAKFFLERGRYAYSVRLRTIRRRFFQDPVFQDRSGSGFVDITEDEENFTIDGGNDAAWLIKEPRKGDEDEQ